MATWFRYGPYIHVASEVQLAVSKHATFSARGYRQALDVTFHLSGVLISTDGTIATLTTQMNSLENAYANDGLDAGLYLDSGCTNATNHIISSGQTIGGTRVMALEWVNGDGTEYVTKRGYSITLLATFPGTNNLLEWHEGIFIRGNGGSRVIVLESLAGNPQPQTTCLNTKCTASQKGTAKGLFTWVPAPAPIWPGALRNDLIGGGLETPIRAANGTWQFPTSWDYSYESDGPLSGVPTIV